MVSEKKSYVNQCIITVLMVLSIVFITFLTYRDILGYFFTALDTFNIIEESRIKSFGDVIGLFKKTMTEEFAWYRPVAVLVYGINYSIWKLNPFGYFLTNLILHITVSVLVFFFVKLLLNGKQLIAWLIAIIFTTHPIHVENLPALRMNDIIATQFLLVSLILFMKYFASISRNKSYFLFSIFFYALALGSKEIAVILPALIFSYLVIFSLSGKNSFKDVLSNAIIKCLPYVAVTLMYLILRAYIVHGIGGYTSSFGGSAGTLNIIRQLININIDYFSDLIYPADFLRLNYLFSPFPTALKQTGFVIALFGFSISLIFFFKSTGIKIIDGNNKKIIKTLQMFLAAIIILSLMGILVYPLVSPYINKQIQQAYNGMGPHFIAKQMDNIGIYPLKFYIYKARDLILRVSLLSFLISTICLIMINQRNTLKQYIISSNNSEAKSFLLIWLLLPLGIYLVTITFDHHDMYISVVPFSAILFIIIVESFQSAKQRITEHVSLSFSFISGFFNAKIMIIIIITGLSASLLAYSPLMRTYGEWKDSGEIQRMFLDNLSKILPELPNDAVIHIYNFPGGISSYKSEIPHAKEVAYYADFSIKAWIDMIYPANNMNVIMHGKIHLPVSPRSLDFEIEYREQNNVRINIIYNYDNENEV